MSILLTIKKLLGITDEDTSFDTDIMIHINAAFMVLRQLGVGPKTGFFITGQTEEWTDFEPNVSKLEMIKTYIYLRVRKAFDPPAASNVLQSIDEMLKEHEFRLNVEAETPTLEDET